MVWFQCEDCGENLKKPKLPNHFRICFASKLSCIDCGVMFGKDSVQSHTQCITEAEKYGPKGQVRASNGVTSKPRKDLKQLEFDINVGLSQRPPWFCSLCNSTATSKQTLLGHADGKKHRAKARAFHAANQQPKQLEESAPETNAPIENSKEGFPDTKNQLEQKVQDLPEMENGHPCEKKSKKKRKSGTSGNDLDNGNASEELNNGVIGVKETKVEGTESLFKKAKQDVLKEDKMVDSTQMKYNTDQKIKWKKLIKLALISNPDRVLKMKKLKKLVLKSLKESGIAGDENQLGDILEQKINSISRFRVDKKFVRLVAKD